MPSQLSETPKMKHYFEEINLRRMHHQLFGIAFTKSEEQVLLRKMAEAAENEGALSTASEIYRELKDNEKVREITELFFSRKNHEVIDMYLALSGYEYLKDKRGILRTIQSGNLDQYSLEAALKSYLGNEIIEKVEAGFAGYHQRKGFEEAIYFEIGKLANMAYNFVGNYDFCMGIAKGGLFSAYIFGLMGMENRIAECHGHNRKRSTFKWIDETTRKDVEGKRVLVLDKDVVTGKTTERVLKELNGLNPEYVDLALFHNPIQGSYGIGTIASNIPEGYRKVFFPKDFNYNQFEEVENRLIKAIETP